MFPPEMLAGAVDPEDIAEIIAFLAGPARWINGQVINANGGSAA